ncbi:PhoX domain-containing protein [Pluteus cervinus]|uniref:PhoX domain-containing protein n=1 Tax=Pluteus cervinus TaxID=181527 RepID=A0ACD3BHT9_9AGAR|nr:PhoX domain-containing protein [Pluteus cervinus]
MSNLFTTRAVVVVGLLAVVLPVVSRVASSPLGLLLATPILIPLVVLLFLLATISLGHILDRTDLKQSPPLAQAARPFAFSTPAAWQAVLTRSQWSQNAPHFLPPLVPELQHVSTALNEVLILIVRDFVLTWYKELSQSPSFPTSVSAILHETLKQLLERSSDVDLPVLVVKRILPKVTEHIELFRQSEHALRGAELERHLTQSEELDLLLANRYTNKGKRKLHPAIDNLSTTFTTQSEQMHLRRLADKILPLLLPPKEARSRAILIVAREIVACEVLFPAMEMLSDPDFWNRTIDQVAGAAIHQQKLITKVRNVLEAQSPRSQVKTPVPSVIVPMTETITIRTDVRRFESFLRSIGRCASLLDARRLKNDVVGEIRRTRQLLANHEREDYINGEKTEDVVAFLDRLYTAKRKVEERIVVLGGEDVSRQMSVADGIAHHGLSLRDILQNPNSLSYFMEFMDRRQRSLLVQFWLTVESFKNPLESVDSDSSGDEDDPINAQAPPETVQEDITMIHDLYFSGPVPHPALSMVSRKYVDNIKGFASSTSPQPVAAQRKIRRSVLLAQRQIEKSMETDFEDFERSELWFRAVGDTELKDTSVFQADAHARLRSSSPRPASPQSPTPRGAKGSQVNLPTKSQKKFQRTASASSTLSLQSASSSGASPSRPPVSSIEVLMSPIDMDSDSARAPLFDDPEDALQRKEEQQMAAIQAALTDIIALDQEEPSSSSFTEGKHRRKTSASRRAVMFSEAAYDSSPGEDNNEDNGVEDSVGDLQGSYHLPAPGDLQLSHEIDRLGDHISRLQAQDAMLDSLIRKAELTGDTQELRLLKRSKSSMTRELRQLKFQKLQYEQQESASRLYSDRTKVSIASSTVGDEGGKAVVRYLIEVQQLAPDGSFASGWVVARRYNEFLNTHNKLRDRYALVRNLDFPGKRLVTSLTGSFVDTRKTALERYLQGVVAIPVACESDELRTFLSRNSPFVVSEGAERQSKGNGNGPFSGANLVRNVYRSVAESIDDMFFGPSMLDVMIQRLTRQAAEFAGIVGSSVNDEELVAQALNAAGKNGPDVALAQLPGDLKPLEGESSTSTFSAPICDLVLAVFELNTKNNWLRRQAIVIILQQVLGGTIERKLQESAKTYLDEGRILTWLKSLRDGLWPGGRLKPPTPPRTTEEKIRTRDDANRKLSSLVPDLAANMIGRTNARRGARRMFAVLQNRRLNQHIAYTILDEVIIALFPEIGPLQTDDSQPRQT